MFPGINAAAIIPRQPKEMRHGSVTARNAIDGRLIVGMCIPLFIFESPILK
ncbi:MAG: hypothetical protein H0U18_01380 [Pyrinomonadaceae bacterium]|nr:hypothetical protein [Pyrinomonadaceae bacterium]